MSETTANHDDDEQQVTITSAAAASARNNLLIELDKQSQESLKGLISPGSELLKSGSKKLIYGSLGELGNTADIDGSGEDSAEYEGLVYRDVSQASVTLQKLNVLRKNRQLCDLILQLDEDSMDIYCHQTILACNSKFFMEIFSNYEQNRCSSASTHDITTASSGIGHDDSLDSQSKAHSVSPPKQDKQDASSVLSPTSHLRKQSAHTSFLASHAGNHRQVVFCLADYLRHYLSDRYYQHHHVSLNSSSFFFNRAATPLAADNNLTGSNTSLSSLGSTASSCSGGGGGRHSHHLHPHHPHHHHKKSHHYSGGCSQVELDTEALRLCIDFLYTSQLRVPLGLIPRVYTLAYHLSFDTIVQACGQYLTKHLNADNCLSIRCFALDEKLIQASNECIERNIEYILQLHSTTTTTNDNNNNGEQYNLHSASLHHYHPHRSTSSHNQANKDFNHLPRIKIELVCLSAQQRKLPEQLQHLNQLCLDWLAERLKQSCGNENHQHHHHGKPHHSSSQTSLSSIGASCSLEELCDSELNMLYIDRNDLTLHDCCDMLESDRDFSNYIHDYQQQHHKLAAAAGVAHLHSPGGQPVQQQQQRSSPSNGTTTTTTTAENARLKLFKITDQEMNSIVGSVMPIKLHLLHDNEIICTHQMSESSFITLCQLNGKVVVLNVHIQQQQHKQDENDDDDNNNNSNGAVVTITTTTAESAVGSAVDRLHQDLNHLSIKTQLSCSSSTTSETHSPDHLDDDPSATPTRRTLSQNEACERLAKLLTPRCTHGLIPLGDGSLMIVGGYERGECLNSCEVYEPARNLVSPMLPGMVNKRGRAAIAYHAHTNSVYVFGGSDGHEDLNSMEAYSLKEHKWTSTEFDFELKCTNLGAVAHAEFIYLVGLKHQESKSMKHCLRYDPVNKKFSRIAELNQGRTQCALAAADTCLYVFGGHDQIKCLSSCEVYNVREDKWTLIEAMHEPRRGCGAAVHGKHIYIVGGTNGLHSLKSVEIYDMETRKWLKGPDMNVARNNVAIAFMGDVLLAVGGFDGKTFLRSIEYLNCKNLSKGWSVYYKPVDFEDSNKQN